LLVLVGYPIKTIGDENKLYTLFSIGNPSYDPGNESNYQWKTIRAFDPEKEAAIKIDSSNSCCVVEAALPFADYRTSEMEKKQFLYCCTVKRTSVKIKLNRNALFDSTNYYYNSALLPNNDSFPVFAPIPPGNLETITGGTDKYLCNIFNKNSGVGNGSETQTGDRKFILPAIPSNLMDLRWTPIFIAEDNYGLGRPDWHFPKELSMFISLKKTIEFYSKLCKNDQSSNSYISKSEIIRLLIWLKDCNDSKN